MIPNPLTSQWAEAPTQKSNSKHHSSSIFKPSSKMSCLATISHPVQTTRISKDRFRRWTKPQNTRSTRSPCKSFHLRSVKLNHLRERPKASCLHSSYNRKLLKQISKQRLISSSTTAQHSGFYRIELDRCVALGTVSTRGRRHWRVWIK